MALDRVDSVKIFCIADSAEDDVTHTKLRVVGDRRDGADVPAAHARGHVVCRIEVALLQAKLRADAGDREAARRPFDAVEAWLGDPALREDMRPRYGESPDLATALSLFEGIPDDPFIPFIRFASAMDGVLSLAPVGCGAGHRFVRLAEQHGMAVSCGSGAWRSICSRGCCRTTRGAAVKRGAEVLSWLLEDEDLLRRVRCGDTPP